jgi:3-dehydroquinate synthase
LGPASYEIRVGYGLLDELPSALHATCPAQSYAIISDSNVAPHYGQTVLTAVQDVAECTLFAFPAGERLKTRSTWADLTDQMLSAGIGRDGAVIAVGGGVVGDIGGFVAATYLRGIPYVHVPTSLLAMIDSSIGGKTGIDTPHGKNLVGAFHQPRAVFADLGTLSTLPDNQFRAGMAEALKHGAIADADYFDSLARHRDQVLARDPDALRTTISRSIEIKRDVVEEDVGEAGKRAALNAGHTLGHAIEATSGYNVLHGEAVAVGLVLEAELGESLGITEPDTATRLRSAIERYGLPGEAPPGISADQIIDAMEKDKKNRAGSMRFSLLKTLGHSARRNNEEWTVPVSRKDLRIFLKRRIPSAL